MKIKVEQKHIDAGRRMDGRECPVALAMTEQMKMPIAVMGFSYGYLVDGYTREVFRMPEEARARVHDFDNGKGMQPFEFELDDLPEALREN